MYLYNGSWDPQHRWHYNIIKKTEAQYGEPVDYMIVLNPAKDQWLLSLQERQRDAIISFFSYGVRDGEIDKNHREQALQKIKDRIHIASNLTEILAYMDKASGLVRWIRNEEDRNYSLDLLSKFWKPEWLDKAIVTYQDPAYIEISSAEYKKAYALLYNEWYQLPNIYDFLDSEKIGKTCTNLLHDAWDISDNILKLKGEIVEYAELVRDLTKSWRYDDLWL